MTVAKFQEDGYDEGSETLTIGLDTTTSRVCLSTESADTWPPLYFTLGRAREIGQALLDAARAADGSTDPASLFAEPAAHTEAGTEWVHTKTGNVYHEVCRAHLNVSDALPGEGDEVVIYRGSDGLLWAREDQDFRRRFKPAAPLAPSAEPSSEASP